VLDGATNALDNLTERAVMDAVHNLGHQMTIILITHRLTTMRECDRIFLLNRGKLVGEGTLDHLIRQDAAFRQWLLRSKIQRSTPRMRRLEPSRVRDYAFRFHPQGCLFPYRRGSP